MLIAMIGYFVDGDVGIFLRLVGSVGILITGGLLVTTGDVLIGRRLGREKDHRTHGES
jgi:hypothetical protein